MIERTQGWKVGKQFFTDLNDAQAAELRGLFKGENLIEPPIAAEVAGFILSNAPKIMDVLTTTSDSRPKARKIHGGTKPRKAKAPEVAT